MRVALVIAAILSLRCGRLRNRRAAGAGRAHRSVGADAGETRSVDSAAQTADEDLRHPRQAQRATELERGRRERQPLPRLLHFHGARREDPTPLPSGQPRVLDRAGRANPIHDRRRRAVRRDERIPGAGAEAPRLQHGDGRRRAVAALRGVDGERADYVSVRRNAGAGARREIRAGERCERERHLRRGERPVHRLQPRDVRRKAQAQAESESVHRRRARWRLRQRGDRQYHPRRSEDREARA